jgi:hypothetical protein
MKVFALFLFFVVAFAFPKDELPSDNPDPIKATVKSALKVGVLTALTIKTAGFGVVTFPLLYRHYAKKICNEIKDLGECSRMYFCDVRNEACLVSYNIKNGYDRINSVCEGLDNYLTGTPMKTCVLSSDMKCRANVNLLITTFSTDDWKE